MIDETMIAHVSGLAQLRLTEEEKTQVQKDLNNILHYMDLLDELDTDSVTPTSHSVDVYNVFREDKVLPSQPVYEVLANSADTTEQYFRVPRTVDE